MKIREEYSGQREQNNLSRLRSNKINTHEVESERSGKRCSETCLQMSGQTGSCRLWQGG